MFNITEDNDISFRVCIKCIRLMSQGRMCKEKLNAITISNGFSRDYCTMCKGVER